MELKGRTISVGKAKGIALVSTMGISFFGGVDPVTGIVVEKGHDLEGWCLMDKILIFPQGKGSTVGSYTLFRMKKNNVAPKAIINSKCETIVAIGAIISEIPCVDMIDINSIKNGSVVEVDGDLGIIRIGG